MLLALDVNPIWLGVMVGVNLQTSFLTPPFGFALFYLRGVAPSWVSTGMIYKGVIPFVLLQSPAPVTVSHGVDAVASEDNDAPSSRAFRAARLESGLGRGDYLRWNVVPWALENPEETVRILADVAAIDPAIAEKVLLERTVIDLDPVPGETQRAVLEVVGPIFVESGDVSSQDAVDDALDTLFEPRFAEAADPSRIAA